MRLPKQAARAAVAAAILILLAAGFPAAAFAQEDATALPPDAGEAAVQPEDDGTGGGAPQAAPVLQNAPQAAPANGPAAADTFAVTTSSHVPQSYGGGPAGTVVQTVNPDGSITFTITPLNDTIRFFIFSFDVQYVFDKLVVDGSPVTTTAVPGSKAVTYTYTPDGNPRPHTMVAYFSPLFSQANAFNLDLESVQDDQGNAVPPARISSSPSTRTVPCSITR